jgi:hypothetical protein
MDLNKIWADMNKPEEYVGSTLEDFFEVKGHTSSKWQKYFWSLTNVIGQDL